MIGPAMLFGIRAAASTQSFGFAIGEAVINVFRNGEEKIQSNASERLFAELCAQIYLKGFVFHGPKFKAPTE